MASGITVIDPVSIPDAAAIDFGGGDVRHFGPDDGMSAVAISNPTRQLAARDNTLRDKLNEVITLVNNKEQFINMPVMRTTLPPAGSSEIVANYRIPAGFEARVLNANVAPASTSLLQIFYSAATFGATTGTQIVSTAGSPEFSGGTVFYGTGEFVVKITNNDTQNREIVASIILTMRPVGPQAGGIIGPGATGAKGSKGDKGDTGAGGIQGPPGGLGGPGLTWRSVWASGSNYITSDVVRYNFMGTSGFSSYVAIAPSTNIAPPDPLVEINGNWELLAQSASAAAVGPAGPTGARGFTFRGSWVNVTDYSVDDVVVYTTGSISRTFYTNGSDIIGTPPPSLPSAWQELFGPSLGSSFFQNSVQGKFITGGNYVQGTANGQYVSAASGTYPLTFNEFTADGGIGAANEITWLRQTGLFTFSGSVFIELPQTGSAWSNMDVDLVATIQGSIISNGSTVPTVDVAKVGSTQYRVNVLSTNTPPNVQILLNGAKLRP